MGKMELIQSLTARYELTLCHLKALLEKSQEFKEKSYRIERAGLEIDVFRNVFSPGYFDDSEYFANNLPDVKGLRVLEVGTGTGLIAIKLAKSGASTVVATDINPSAVENARSNVKLHKLEPVIDVRDPDDIFEAVQQEERFDLIFWNIPFCYLDADLMSEIGLKPELSQLEKSVFNLYYDSFRHYLKQGFDYLTAGGRLLLAFSPSIGKQDHLEYIVKDLGLAKELLKEDKILIDGTYETLQLLEFTRQ